MCVYVVAVAVVVVAVVVVVLVLVLVVHVVVSGIPRGFGIYYLVDKGIFILASYFLLNSFHLGFISSHSIPTALVKTSTNLILILNQLFNILMYLSLKVFLTDPYFY